MSKKPKSNGHGQRGHNSGSLWLSRIYNIVDRDPEIERFEAVFAKDKLKESELAVLAGLSASTVSNMFSVAKTRRPQHATFAKMAGALGYKYGLVREGDAPDYESELPKAREQFKAHKEAQAKMKARKR